MKNFKHQLILASKSPRRQQLLKEAGFEFEILTTDVNEDYAPDLPVGEVAGFLAHKKAKATLPLAGDAVVIASDTIVVFDNKVLGKPKDKAEAQLVLAELSGQTHDVITGVCLMNKSKEVTISDTTKVTFKEISSEEIDYYIDHYQPYDKAGSYGIQEWLGMIAITKIEGSHFNVMGLPMHRLYAELLKF